MKYEGRIFALTRLGFELSVAPKIMTMVLKTVLNSNQLVSEGADSFVVLTMSLLITM